MKTLGLSWRIEMCFEDAYKLIKQYGGYMFRFEHKSYLLHYDCNINKLCTVNGKEKVNPVLFSTDLSANDWIVDLAGCWKDQ